MAALSAMGCCREAAGLTVARLECIVRDCRLSLDLRHCWKQGFCSFSSSACSRAANVRRGRLSRLDVHARGGGIKLGDDVRGMGPSENVEKVEMREDSIGCFIEKAFLTGAIALIPLVDGEAASAKGGEFGLLEGRSVALIHPLVMGSLFAYTLYAGYLGWQWRRVRTIQNEINQLKKQVEKVPVAAGDKSPPVAPPSPVEAQISSLSEERKELVKGGFRDRHWNAGSIILGLGVFAAVAGPVNTWFRTGKLFPGPHLFVGAGITICWALAAALVPPMQKGNETARNLHIGLNLINVFLFVWQIPTGLEIVGIVFKYTTWP